MAAEKIELEVALKDLGGHAKDANLNAAQKSSYAGHLNKAQLALDTKDWKTFQKHFNAMVGILKNAVGASKDVSQALKTATAIRDALAKDINKLKDRKGEIESTITKSGKLKATKAQSLYSGHERYSKVKNTSGKQISDYGAAAEGVSKIKVSAQKITNEIAQAAGFADKAAAQAAMAIIKEIEKVRQVAVEDAPKVETELEQKEKEQLEASQEVDRLTLSAGKSSESIVKLYQAIDELGIKTNAAVTNIRNNEKVTASGSEAAPEFEDTTKQVEKQSSSLGKAFKQFTLYAIALRAVKKAAREAVKTVKDLDRYLTEQAMVTGRTRQQTYALLKSYQDLAKQLGTTTKEVAEVATQYMRQGKTAEDALKLTKAAVSAAKVAGISASESVTYLTTALNGFQLSANDAMLVSDKFAAIAAQSASSYEELAIALSKVASQANLAGMSIDYTTALLAKGLETTREAPETIGTALKTVIARMREMGDYGETLEGDTDINNVETQLAYVDIKLKNVNGELRSTEEVLDELGKKWDTLSVNQQAAVAKALAGTRQQSRLIAMMTDYERVTELQEISQRSAGATMAQMETYLQGMDAAINKLSNAWEQIVTNLTKSDVIINIINGITDLLNKVASALEDDAVVLGTIITLSGLILIHYLKKWETQKAINKAALQKQKADREELINRKQQYIQELKNFIAAGKNNKVQKEKLKNLYKQNKAIAEQRGDMAAAAKYAGLIAELDASAGITAQEQANAAKELALAESEVTGLKIEQAETDLAILQNSQGFVSLLGNALSILTPILTIMSLINMVQQAINAGKLKEIALTEKNNAKEKSGLFTKVAAMFSKVVGAFSSAGIPGVIAGIAIATALAAALGVGIAAAAGAFNTTTAEEDINSLSASIYNLQKTATAIQTVESKFDALDNKVIKTNKDLQEMNELLASAGDSMSTEVDYASIAEKTGWTEKRAKRVYDRAKKKKDEGKNLTKNEQAALDAQGFGGLTEQEYYNSLSDSDKRVYLDKKQKELEEKLDKARKEQLDLINKETDKEKYKAEVTALTNAEIYKQIDALEGLSEESKKATEQIAEALTNELSATEQLKYLNDPSKLKGLINRITDTGMAEALTSDSATLSEKINAYKKITAQLTTEELKAFNTVYRELSDLVRVIDNSNGTILTYIEKFNISSEKINDLHEALGDKYLGVLESLTAYTDVETGVVDLQEVIKANFGDLEKGSEEYKKVLLALEKTIGESMLNIGQSITKTSNQINTVYETALKWSTMSAADQGSFLSENSELFKNNPDLYRAFQTGDLSKIEKALSQSEALQKDVQERIRTVNSQLAIEEARSEEDRNEFMIQYLRDQLDMLQDEENFYKASLDVRVDLEKKQLDIYKEYLQKQQDELTKALEKRKDAYSKYFEAVNQEEEDNEYEKQANLLASNLSKIASSDNAASKQQTKELEKELRALEEDRIKELRERAQEAVLQNLDDQVEEINQKFDKLLENNQNLLAAMLTSEENKDDFIANMVSSNIAGMTANEAAQWFNQDFMTTFGSILSKDALTNIENTISEVLNLNVNGGNVMITEQQQQALYKVIMDALQQIGYS